MNIPYSTSNNSDPAGRYNLFTFVKLCGTNRPAPPPLITSSNPYGGKIELNIYKFRTRQNWARITIQAKKNRINPKVVQGKNSAKSTKHVQTSTSEKQSKLGGG